MAKGPRRNAPSGPGFTTGFRNSKSNTSSGLPTPTTEAAKTSLKESIKVNTDVASVAVDPALLDRLSPSVRDVAEHAAVLKSVLARLGPIYDLVEREASRMTEVSPFLAGKDQVCHASTARISDINLLYRPGGRSEKSFGHRGTGTRGEDPRHQGND
jgi:hypothetical protein